MNTNNTKNIWGLVDEYTQYSAGKKSPMRPAKWLALNKHSLTQQEIETFTWLVRARLCTINGGGRAQETPIITAYTNYDVWTPMTGQPVWQFYQSIGVNSCATAHANGKMIARAIIWPQPLVSGLMAVDVQLTGDPLTMDIGKWLIRHWALSHNMACLVKHDFTNGHVWLLPGGETVKTFPRPYEANISLKNVTVPYMDTFFQATKTGLWAGNCTVKHTILSSKFSFDL